MKAQGAIKAEKIDYVLAVGGGSVIDGAKFIAAAALFEGDAPWDSLAISIMRVLYPLCYLR